jgi:hypothetical protein
MVLMRVDFPRPVCPGVPQVRGCAANNDGYCHEDLNLPTQITLNWNPRFNSLRSICVVILSKPTWLRGYTDCWAACLSMVAIVAAEEIEETEDASMIVGKRRSSGRC